MDVTTIEQKMKLSEKFPCHICSKEFYRKDYVPEHMRRCHTTLTEETKTSPPMLHPWSTKASVQPHTPAADNVIAVRKDLVSPMTSAKPTKLHIAIMRRKKKADRDALASPTTSAKPTKLQIAIMRRKKMRARLISSERSKPTNSSKIPSSKVGCMHKKTKQQLKKKRFVSPNKLLRKCTLQELYSVICYALQK
jgi:hypothetical protein